LWFNFVRLVYIKFGFHGSLHRLNKASVYHWKKLDPVVQIKHIASFNNNNNSNNNNDNNKKILQKNNNDNNTTNNKIQKIVLNS